jgi:RHS repeat-associated protein
LLAEVRYPDKSTGAASTSNSDKDRYAYNALGDFIKLTDRNQSTREFTYDAAGRHLTDAATVLGSGVDGAVRRVETAYDTAGRAFKFTSYDAATAGNVVNQVQRAFNGLGQVTREYENHDGAVNTSTTPYVAYGYDTAASSGVLTKGSRATTLTYPNGRVVTSNYASGLDDTVSRLSSLTDGGTTLESYSYLGPSTVVVRAHPQPGVDLTYVAASGTGDAGDQYTGLDRFGRVLDVRWTKGASDLDRFVHTYDRNSNRLTRDVLATSGPTTLDEAYNYDNLDRLTKTNRGTLASGTITDGNATYTRNWTLDLVGNWNSLATDADGGGAGSSSSESRTHNGQNQVTAVGASSMTFDSNGSLISDGTTGKTYAYDAWNRLVKVQSGGSTIAVHEYDALSRQAQSGTTTPTDERWFSLNWQVLETRPSDGKTTQQVWSPVYIDAMVCRDRDTDANGSLDERVYALHDANFDVTVLVDTSGTVLERFTYDRYGTFAVLDANWAADADGVSDVAWRYLFQGLRFDALGGGYDIRHRYYLPSLGRAVQVDPTGYPDGMSRYEWERSNPVAMLDPFGLQAAAPDEMQDHAREMQEEAAEHNEFDERRLAEERRIDRLVGELEGADFDQREAAAEQLRRALDRLDPAATRQLREILEAGAARGRVLGPEARARLRRLLDPPVPPVIVLRPADEVIADLREAIRQILLDLWEAEFGDREEFDREGRLAREQDEAEAREAMRRAGEAMRGPPEAGDRIAPFGQPRRRRRPNPPTSQPTTVPSDPAPSTQPAPPSPDSD